MRFCMITTFYPPYHFGGDAVFVQRLAHELARRGHAVDVIHNVDAYRLLARRKPGPAVETDPRVTVHGLRSPLGPLALLAMHQTGRPSFYGAQMRRILSQPFDVIHYHNISLAGGPAILGYGDAIKLYTLHEYWLICPAHVMFKNRREPCPLAHRAPRGARAAGCLRCTLAHRRPPQLWRYGPALAPALAHVDRFIAAAQFVRRLHEPLGIGPRTVVLPHFALPPAPEGEHAHTGHIAPEEERAHADEIAPEEERMPARENAPHRSPAPTAGDRDSFLFVGRLDRSKGLHTILPVFLRRPDLNLVVVGAGSEEGNLRAMTQGCANVRFAGPRQGEELRGFYRRAIALLVPSLCYEICPLVILEAFAEGTPVIARRIGTLPELVIAGARGETFETAAQAEEAMDRLRGDAPYREALSRACLDCARGEYSIERYMERYLAIIEEVRSARTRTRDCAFLSR